MVSGRPIEMCDNRFAGESEVWYGMVRFDMTSTNGKPLEDTTYRT